MSTMEDVSLGFDWGDLRRDMFWVVTTYLPAQNYVDLLMYTAPKHNMIEASQNHTETHLSDVEVKHASSQGR
jgi:hypothetical protein